MSNVASDEPVYTEIGGIRIGDSFWSAMNATWPFASLKLFNEKIIVRYLSKVVEFKKEEIHHLEKSRGLYSCGVRIDHKKSNISPFIIFWSFSTNKLMDKLKEAGYPVK